MEENEAKGKYVPALRFDWLTPIYDPVVRLTTRERTFKNALVNQAELRSGDSILDLGCGSGTLAFMLDQAGADLIVYGIDGDAKILNIARSKAAAADNRIRFVQSMSFDLPFRDESFDHIFSTLFFHHLSTGDKLSTFKEVRRVLKPSGLLHVADWGRPDNFATKLGSYIVMALDGTYTTRDNFEGRLPGLITDAGFDQVRETKAVNTSIGTVRLFKSAKSAIPGVERAEA